MAEGPYLYEENGKIVLLWSTYTKTGYSVFRSVSENGVYGDYTIEKKILKKTAGTACASPICKENRTSFYISRILRRWKE